MAQLLLLFITIPFIELVLLLMLSERMGWAPTLGLVVFTGVVGANLARHQGLRTIQKLQQEVSGGQMPATALMDAAMILVAGALLLTPGVLTDLFGFSLLIPFCRHAYRRGLAGYIQRNFKVTTVNFEDLRAAMTTWLTVRSSSRDRVRFKARRIRRTSTGSRMTDNSASTRRMTTCYWIGYSWQLEAGIVMRRPPSTDQGVYIAPNLATRSAVRAL